MKEKEYGIAFVILFDIIMLLLVAKGPLEANEASAIIIILLSPIAFMIGVLTYKFKLLLDRVSK